LKKCEDNRAHQNEKHEENYLSEMLEVMKENNCQMAARRENKFKIKDLKLQNAALRLKLATVE
jgi:hypothetical protein